MDSYYQGVSPGHLIPGPDGKIIYTARGLFSNEAKPLGVNLKSRDGIGPWCVPALHGNYYLSVNLNSGFGPKRQPSVVSVHLGGDERVLITLPNIPIPKGANQWGRDKFGHDHRLLLIPDAKVIVTIPESNNQLVIHRFDIEETLDKSGIDYLYAASRAPGLVGKGKEYVYQIATRSKKGGVTYKLESGPEGMRVTKEGIVYWKVRPDHPAGDTSVIVTIADQSGQEIFHTFRVAVVEEVPAATKGDEKEKK